MAAVKEKSEEIDTLEGIVCCEIFERPNMEKLRNAWRHRQASAPAMASISQL